jgi:hypothetical protein
MAPGVACVTTGSAGGGGAGGPLTAGTVGWAFTSSATAGGDGAAPVDVVTEELEELAERDELVTSTGASGRGEPESLVAGGTSPTLGPRSSSGPGAPARAGVSAGSADPPRASSPPPEAARRSREDGPERAGGSVPPESGSSSTVPGTGVATAGAG